QAFLQWIAQSRDHLRIYFETRETLHRLKAVDLMQRVDIEEMLAARHADVIPLFGYSSIPRPRRRRGWIVGTAAAACAAAAIGLALGWSSLHAQEFSTAIGEQRTCKLDDGSFVYLNTDSRIRVSFSTGQRHIELVEGEALFVVEHDPVRPFIVTSGDTHIRA